MLIAVPISKTAYSLQVYEKAEQGVSSTITHLLFDLGGVIVELNGPPVRNEWTGAGNTDEEVWQKWLTSSTPRMFESGAISPDQFAKRMVAELDMIISPEKFLECFANWPVGPFAGALDLLAELKKRYHTALFSNSNEVHWKRKMGEMRLGSAFHDHFASHLIGYVKPDSAAFDHVIASLQVEPACIFFVDDNQMNVDAALAAGMQSERVRGLAELKASLLMNGIK